jgi:hypothetical protein
MYDRLAILQLIEDAEHAEPFCECGAPMVAADRGGALWLECSERHRPRHGRLARIAYRLGLHSERELLAAPALLAA